MRSRCGRALGARVVSPEPTLLARVRSHTARVREAMPAEPSRILRVTVASRSDGFVGDLRLVEQVEPHEELQRRIPGKTCEEVLAAAALIAALAIDPTASTTPGFPPRTPEWSARRWTRDRAREGNQSRAIRANRRDVRSGARRSSSRRAPARRSRPTVSTGSCSGGASGWKAAGEDGASRAIDPALRLRLGQTRSFTVEAEGRPAFFELTTPRSKDA